MERQVLPMVSVFRVMPHPKPLEVIENGGLWQPDL
jgi:hypothetical protein